MSEQDVVPNSATMQQSNWLNSYMPDNQVGFHHPQTKWVDFATIRGILYRQRWIVGGALVASLIAGLVLTLLATPMYEARSTVRIEPYAGTIVEGQDLDSSVASNQIWNLMETQIGVITSRNLATAVAENLNLADRFDFLGADVDRRRPPNMTDEEWRQAKTSMAVDILQGAVSAEIPANNWIIQIAYQSADPVIAAEMANAFADAFVASEAQESLDNNEYAQSYLRDQIATTRTRLQEAEQAANRYARANGIIIQSPSSEDDGGPATTLTTANLVNINQRVSAAQAARIEAEQRWRSIQNLPAEQLAEVQNNALLQGLISERANRLTQLDQLRQRLGPSHPEIVAVERQLETLNEQIASASANIRAAIRTDFVVAQNQASALEVERATMTGETLAEQDRRVDYSVLEREAQALRDQLQVLLERFNQISAASNVQTGRINLLDRAIVPGAPFSPSLVRNLGLALVLGIGLAGVLAVLREALDDSIRSIEDVEERTGLTLLGHTPYLAENDMEHEDSNKFGVLMEAYTSIRSTIDFSMPRDRSVIQLTSSQASEGKSTTAVILAELFAAMGRKTLLIDADLRRPSIASLLEIPKPKAGLAEVLLGHTDLQSAVMKGVHENLDILPVAEKPAKPAELLASRQLKEFIDVCRRQYSLIIFDSCPVLGLADAPILSNLVDGTIFVMEANRVSSRQARGAIRRLRDGGGKPVGAILTKYRALEAGDAYGYQYAYYEYGNSDATA